MPEQDRSYFTWSWALLTRDRGWMKPVLVLAVSTLVPIVGLLGVQGYALEWARLTAWGVDASPKQKDVRVGECIASGWRAFLASVGYSLVSGIILSALGNLFGNGVLWNAVSFLMTNLVGLVCAIAALRATIYQQPWAGYQLRRIWDMVSRDPSGLARVGLVLVLGSLGVSVVVGTLSTFALFPMMMHLFMGLEGSGLLYLEKLGHSEMRVLFYEVADAIAAMAPWITVVLFVGALCTTVMTLLSYNALALWMRQFDVPNWGASDDPLPDTIGQPMTSAPSYGYGYQQPTYVSPQQMTPVPSGGPTTTPDSVESMPDAFEPTESPQVDDLEADESETTVVIELTPAKTAVIPSESVVASAPAERANAWYEAVFAHQRSDREDGTSEDGADGDNAGE